MRCTIIAIPYGSRVRIAVHLPTTHRRHDHRRSRSAVGAALNVHFVSALANPNDMANFITLRFWVLPCRRFFFALFDVRAFTKSDASKLVWLWMEEEEAGLLAAP